MYKVSSDPVDIQQLGKYLAALGITGTAAAALTKKLSPATAAANKIASAVYTRHIKSAGLAEDVDQMMGMRRRTRFGGNEAIDDLIKRQLAENMEFGRRTGAVGGTLMGALGGAGVAAHDDLLALAPLTIGAGAGIGNLAGRGIGMAGGALATPASVLNSLISTPITRTLSRKIF